jgi:hypothetical protein
MFFEYTEAELDLVFKSYFESKDPLKLIIFPSKEKKKYLTLHFIKDVFKFDVIYTESEVNALLKPIYHDYVTIRRYLIDYGFLKRARDGSMYQRM